uniref:Fibrinogen C-terminal domain-containing protein n=1 Tax=Macrostomum lignano TaxID=282301 RepID=A0A1I8JFN4_9PLAT
MADNSVSSEAWTPGRLYKTSFATKDFGYHWVSLTELTMHFKLFLMLLLCSVGLCQGSSAKQLLNVSNLLTEDIFACSSNSLPSMSFVTSLSIRGCPVFVHRLGAVKAGRFVLEPTFCITEPAALRSPGAHFDLLTNEFYFSFPVNVTDETLATEAASMLSHLSPKSVSFLEVTSVRMNSSNSLAFTKASFLWGPMEFIGHLRLTEVFHNIRLVASMRAGEGCARLRARLPGHRRSRSVPPNRVAAETQELCSASLLRSPAVQSGSAGQLHCLHEAREDHFVIEPLLCPTSSFQLLRDFSLGSHYVRLPALIEDESVIAAVRSRIGSASVESLEFMKLWHASIHVSSRLSQWRFEALRLSVDRRTAELRAYCSTQSSCDALGLVLISEPVNFWKNIQWTAVSLLDDQCYFRTQQRRFALRMRDRPPGGPALKTRRNDGRWNAQDLRDRTVWRDGRTFIIINQRGCRASNFQRTWREYVAGFGDESNFWIGLDILHSLTGRQGTLMRVELLLWNETEWFAEYSGFSVDNASNNYRMRYLQMIPSRSSLVFDALSSVKGSPFSAKDKDNHGYSSRHYCSRSWGGNGGWWYSNCGHANPNGIYHFAQSTSTGYSTWSFKEGYRTLKEFRMMRRGKRGHFVIEPLLCPTPSFQLLRDFSLGSHYVRLPALIEDESVIAAVRSRIGSASVESLEFMKLWHASIHVSSRLSQWRFEALRLSVDRRTAELRAYCNTRKSCELLVSIFKSEPVNFWKNVQWTATFLLEDNCELRSEKLRFVFRMKERSGGEGQVSTAIGQKVDSLRNKTVVRNNRHFVIVLQRGCRSSNFNRFWSEYVSGFGDEHNFWIGLETLHWLTSPQSVRMRVEMLLWNDTEWFAEYSGFSVGNAARLYTMKYSSMLREQSSLVYDALASSNGTKFSTRDRDNDGHSTANYCSKKWGGYGGWWYAACGHTNPNGVYNYGDSRATTISGWQFKESYKAAKEFRMMLLLLCSLGASAVPSEQDAADSLPAPAQRIEFACSNGSLPSMSFVTSLSIRGCPVFVHRLGAVKAGRFVLEPTFCITEPAALRSPGAHFDLLTNEFYFSFPVNVTDETLATDAASMLSHLSPKSVSFLEVTSVRINGSTSLAFRKASFLWGPTEFIGHLRLMCAEFACPSLAMNLERDRLEPFDNIRLVASMRAGEGCASFERAFPVTVARAPFLPIESLQRPRSSALPACSDLQLFRVVQLDNCTAYVHQRRGKRGHFVIEPLLCPTPSFQLLRDFSLGSHYVRLPALIEDESVIAAVRSRIGSASVESLEFMKLWHASIHSEPVNFWKGIRWSGSFSLKDECEYRTSQSRFAFRMKDRMSVNSQAVRAALSNLEALSNKTVTRDDRSFLVVVQRNCRTSQFQRYWREYVAGFGDDINFWIGLDTMHRLTSSRSAALRVEILLWNNTEWFAEYSNFVVGPPAPATRCRTDRWSERNQAWSLTLCNSREKFSTRDVDNDGYSASHCSVNWGGYGGWWHKYSSCSYANPNGNYYYGQTTTASYAVWYFVEGFRALKEFRMMIQV